MFDWRIHLDAMAKDSPDNVCKKNPTGLSDGWMAEGVGDIARRIERNKRENCQEEPGRNLNPFTPKFNKYSSNHLQRCQGEL